MAVRATSAALARIDRMAKRVLKIVLLFPLYVLMSESQILSSTTSQEVILNTNATFICNSTVHVKWVINGSFPEAIYPSDSDSVPLRLRDRGFVPVPHQQSSTSNIIVNILRVLGSDENNNTEIDCQPKSGSETNQPALLTVIGPPDSPVNATGSLLQVSPLQVRVEWQEPYSHHNHPVINYTIYITMWDQKETRNSTYVTFTIESEEFSSCEADVRVTAWNDIGESGLSSAATMYKIPTEENFAIEGRIFSQNDISIIIQFPPLCLAQHMSYTVEVREDVSGDIVYHYSTTSEYNGNLLFNGTITSTLQSGEYTVVVHLVTGKQHITSQNLHLIYESMHYTEESGTASEGSDAGTGDILVVAIAVLATVVLCFLVVTIIVTVVLTRNKLCTAGSHEVKQNDNPIYEGPLYENFEEQLNCRPPTTYATQPQTNDASITSNDNIYHTAPINIPSQGREEEGVGLYAELALKSSGVEAEERKSEGEASGAEEMYTIMRSPVGSTATPNYREDRAVWLGNRVVQ